MRIFIVALTLLSITACSMTVGKWKRSCVKVCKCSVDLIEGPCDPYLEAFEEASTQIDERLANLKANNPKAYKRVNKRYLKARAEVKQLHCGW